MSRLYRLTHRLLPARTRLAWSRSRIESGYAKDIATARRTKNHDEVLSLESARLFELRLQQEEEDSHLTKQLRRKARRLRVPIPRVRNDDGSISDQWYEGSQTGGWYLTNAGILSLREEIRKEQKARHEGRAQLIVWLSAITGIVGAITGLVAVLQKSS
ncbi:hypothetical protein JAK58_02810 [Stenotrophomonas maltophilia]|uniref:hypothetical protein n=1 Tax=Stenotrophomonas maltophilia TaxID=40324 RepID=UPI0021C8B8F4|nr:hypothetical protein [Stenotrophomonas maltophilia]MCU1090444.1 hypothetical protein [Stenotrophomonas maltophilia]